MMINPYVKAFSAPFNAWACGIPSSYSPKNAFPVSKLVNKNKESNKKEISFLANQYLIIDWIKQKQNNPPCNQCLHPSERMR